MNKNFDPIRARSSVDALEMLCRSHPEAAINATALREELAAADEQIEQLARALREAVEPPTFMGEPVPHPANRAARMAMDPQHLRDKAAHGGKACAQCDGTGRYGDGKHDGSGRWIECPFCTAGVTTVVTHNRPVRVCTVTDSQCSRECHGGPCKLEKTIEKHCGPLGAKGGGDAQG